MVVADRRPGVGVRPPDRLDIRGSGVRLCGARAGLPSRWEALNWKLSVANALGQLHGFDRNMVLIQA